MNYKVIYDSAGNEVEKIHPELPDPFFDLRDTGPMLSPSQQRRINNGETIESLNIQQQPQQTINKPEILGETLNRFSLINNEDEYKLFVILPGYNLNNCKIIFKPTNELLVKRENYNDVYFKVNEKDLLKIKSAKLEDGLLELIFEKDIDEDLDIYNVFK